MLVELNKEDLVILVNGTNPNFDNMTFFSNLGRYSGSYGTWTWDLNKLKEMNEQQLFDTYKIIKGEV